MQEESFDSFYRSTRRPLLRQVLALCGNLAIARAAVQDAYADAWHRRGRLARLDDPLDWVRPRAWRLAQRRVGRGRQSPGLPDDDHAAVLGALTELPIEQRRVLVLVALAGLDLASSARELGISADAAEQSLQAGTESLAAKLDVPPDRLSGPLTSLDDLLDDTTFPRGPIVRRVGRRRRRGQLLGGAVVATLLVLGVGSLAYAPDDTSAEGLRQSAPPSPSVSDDPAAKLPTAADLLDEQQIGRMAPARSWRVDHTGNNTAGNGINSVCQQNRFADPDGLSAIVRSFRAAGGPRRAAVQTVEISKSAAQARQGFRTTLGWYAGCRVARLQVLDAFHVGNVGDQADILTLRIRRKPVTTVSVAIARTGSVTTSTVGTTSGANPPTTPRVIGSLADAVTKLCARTGTPGCVGRPTHRAVPPPPSGEERGLLAVADLPAVGRITRPWVGTRPVSPRKNPAATTCDEAAFARAGATKRRSRTYLIPRASLPTRFGLSETYGVFRNKKAAATFVSGVRRRVAGCEDRDLATKVGREHREARRSPQVDLSHWNVVSEVSDSEKVHFRVGFVRVGRRVAQVTFAPSPTDDVVGSVYTALLVRAGDRLRELG